MSHRPRRCSSITEADVLRRAAPDPGAASLRNCRGGYISAMRFLDAECGWTTLGCSANIGTNGRRPAMPDWSIKIVPSTTGQAGVLADFVGDVKPTPPAGKFQVQQGDFV